MPNQCLPDSKDQGRHVVQASSSATSSATASRPAAARARADAPSAHFVLPAEKLRCEQDGHVYSSDKIAALGQGFLIHDL